MDAWKNLWKRWLKQHPKEENNMTKKTEDTGKVVPLFKSDDEDPERIPDQEQEEANKRFSDMAPDFTFTC